MDITNLTASQRQSLLDLLVLAMYADGHLDLIEDRRLQELLTAMGFASDYDREKQLDASVTRVRQYSQPVEVARNRAAQLAQNFAALDLRTEIYQFLELQIKSDNQVAPAEHQLLSAIREVFRM